MPIRRLPTKRELELRRDLVSNRARYVEILEELKGLNKWYRNHAARKAYNREVERIAQVDRIREIVKKASWKDLGYTSMEEVMTSNEVEAILKFQEAYPEINIEGKRIMMIIKIIDAKTGNFFGRASISEEKI